ncbi:MAG: PEP-CTERM system TPR-repeat protein PrsT [Gammaproteobacteria bacterium]|nr:PEP-CTERM system TPR-repeat protein PrsT [Gammaproteobacteria bacterium]
MKSYFLFKSIPCSISLALLVASPVAMAAKFDSRSKNDIFSERPVTESFALPPELYFPTEDQLSETGQITKSEYFDILELIKNQNLPEARNKIDAVIKRNPDDPTTYNLQALLDTKEQNVRSARQNYQKALKLDEKNVLAHLGLARLALDANELSAAKKHSEKVVELDKNVVNAYLLLADIALKQNKADDIEKIFETAFQNVRGNLTQELNLANNLSLYYSTHDQSEKILPISREIIERYPNESGALSFLAKAQIVNGQKSLAEKTLEKLISQEKNDITHRLLLAKLLSDNTDNEKRIFGLLNEVLQLDPKNLEAHIHKTVFLVKLRRFDDALNAAENVEQLFPELGVGKMLKGDIYLTQNELDKALDINLKAYSIQPNDQLLLTIVRIMNRQGKANDAIALLIKELEKNPNNTVLHFSLANLYQNQKNYPKAQQHYEAVLSIDPDHLTTLNNLAWLYSEQNNPKALELAKKAYEKSPQTPAIADTYGLILVKQGDKKEGLAILEKTVKSFPDSPAIQFHLAKAYIANENKNQAVSTLKKLLNRENDFPEKQAAMDMLNQLTAR